MRVGDVAVGRAGDKGAALDLTVVAQDDEAYARIEPFLTAERIGAAFDGVVPGPVVRFTLPGLRAVKAVLPDALPGGVYASTHPGLHWQKAAIYVLLDLELP